MVNGQTTRPPGTRRRRVVAFSIILLMCIGAWESYKLLGVALDGTWPFTDIAMKPRPDNRSMPHVWDIVGSLFGEARRNGGSLIGAVAVATLYTLREAALGFAVGAFVGFAIGVVFVQTRLIEKAFMPYVVASQTIPIVAIAPMVIVWGNRLGLPQWISVSLLAAFLTFFPVAINTVRGLRSPEATATELFRSYAASRWQRLWKLQVPASLPYLFTAFKISAAASVVGAIVGELSAGMGDGLARALLNFNQVFTADPSKLYATVLVGAAGALVFVGLVTLAERLAGAAPLEETA